MWWNHLLLVFIIPEYICLKFVHFYLTFATEKRILFKISAVDGWGASLMLQWVKNSPAKQETQEMRVWSLDGSIVTIEMISYVVKICS